MIYIPYFNSARFGVQIKEIPMLGAIKLANMPTHLNEKQTTFLLNSIIEQVDAPDELKNCQFWTVQERMVIVGHYLVAMQDDEPDFLIGENARYSDYFIGEQQFKLDRVEIGEYQEDHWTAIPLLGIMAETIEELEGAIDGVEGHMHWTLGAMACQLVPNDQALDYRKSDYNQQVLDRMLVISQFPETIFLHLLAALNDANQKMMHLFEITLTDQGISAKAKQGGEGMPYARFLAHSALTTISKQLCGKPDLSST